jgi:hypothetical protein
LVDVPKGELATLITNNNTRLDQQKTAFNTAITGYKSTVTDAKSAFDTARSEFAAAEKALAQNKNVNLSDGLVDAVDGKRKVFDQKEVEYGLAAFVLQDAMQTFKALTEARKEIDREAAREAK